MSSTLINLPPRMFVTSAARTTCKIWACNTENHLNHNQYIIFIVFIAKIRLNDHTVLGLQSTPLLKLSQSCQLPSPIHKVLRDATAYGSVHWTSHQKVLVLLFGSINFCVLRWDTLFTPECIFLGRRTNGYKWFLWETWWSTKRYNIQWTSIPFTKGGNTWSHFHVKDTRIKSVSSKE